jgi:hypothetical protein
VVTDLAEVFRLGTAKAEENLAFRRYLCAHHYGSGTAERGSIHPKACTPLITSALIIKSSPTSRVYLRRREHAGGTRWWRLVEALFGPAETNASTYCRLHEVTMHP